MARDRCGINLRQPGQGAQQSIGDKGYGKRQDHPGQQRKQQLRIDAMGCDSGPALEPDGKQQVKRQRLGRSLWHGKIRPRQGSAKAQRKTEDHWRNKVCPGQRHYPVHLAPVTDLATRGVALPPLPSNRNKLGLCRVVLLQRSATCVIPQAMQGQPLLFDAAAHKRKGHQIGQ